MDLCHTDLCNHSVNKGLIEYHKISVWFSQSTKSAILFQYAIIISLTVLVKLREYEILRTLHTIDDSCDKY